MLLGFSMKKALVTGCNGLIGSQCVSYFHDLGFTIVGIDNDMRSYFFGAEASTIPTGQSLESKYNNFLLLDIDIRDENAVNRVYQEHGPFDLIIHTAAQPSHDWAAKEPITDFTINALGTMYLLEGYRNYSPSAAFIFTSTNKVYGDTPNRLKLIELPTRYECFKDNLFYEIDETMTIDNSKHSIFGASKVAADVMVQEYGRYFNLNTVTFRGGCLTGPQHAGAELHGFLSYLVKCIVGNNHYTIFGYKGKQVRDNIHSHDLVTMFHEYYKDPDPGAVYNAGGGRENSVSILEAIDKINSIAGLSWNNYSFSDQARSGDHQWYISDLSKFKKRYQNWNQLHSIDSILEQMVHNEIAQRLNKK